MVKTRAAMKGEWQHLQDAGMVVCAFCATVTNTRCWGILHRTTEEGRFVLRTTRDNDNDNDNENDNENDNDNEDEEYPSEI
jgi:hypothetical protein